jgi:hypothetical protein
MKEEIVKCVYCNMNCFGLQAFNNHLRLHEPILKVPELYTQLEVEQARLSERKKTLELLSAYITISEGRINQEEFDKWVDNLLTTTK